MEPLSPLTSPVDLSPVERLRRSEKAGRALVAGWESSGMTMHAFAKQQGIRAQRLSYWKLRLRRRAKPEIESVAGFVEIVRPSGKAYGCGVAIELPNGIRLRVEPGFDTSVLRSVVATLSGSEDAARC